MRKIMININDIIKVIKQPKDLMAQILGEVAYVNEINADYISIRVINKDGTRGGGGWIPMACVEIENDPIYKVYKKAFDDADEKLYQDGLKRHKKWMEFVETIAKKYEVPSEKALKMFNEMSKFYYDYIGN